MTADLLRSKLTADVDTTRQQLDGWIDATFHPAHHQAVRLAMLQSVVADLVAVHGQADAAAFLLEALRRAVAAQGQQE